MYSLVLAVLAALQPTPDPADFGVAADFARRVLAGNLGEAERPSMVTGRESTAVDQSAYLRQRAGCALNSFTRVGSRNEIGIDWRCKGAKIVDGLRIERGAVVRVDVDLPIVTAVPPAATGARAKSVDVAKWVTSADYPAEALRTRTEGTTGFRLTLSAEGRVTDCVIIQSSGSSVLDSATCGILRRRARFEPARDAKGEAIDSTFSSSFSWRLPKPQPPSPGLMAVRFDLSPTRDVSNCRAESRGMVPEIARTAACAALEAAPPIKLLAVAAASYKSLVLVNAASEGSQSFPIKAAEWGKLISHRSARLTFSAAGTPVACVPEVSFGPGGDPCQRFPAVPAGTNVAQPGARNLVVEGAIFGVPR